MITKRITEKDNIKEVLKNLMLYNYTDYYILTEGIELNEEIIKKAYKGCKSKILGVNHDNKINFREKYHDKWYNYIQTFQITNNFCIIPHTVADLIIKFEFKTIQELSLIAAKRGIDIILYAGTR